MTRGSGHRATEQREKTKRKKRSREVFFFFFLTGQLEQGREYYLRTIVLRGRRGFELFLQCYQLILQKQVHWLINEKGFPAELEVGHS